MSTRSARYRNASRGRRAAEPSHQPGPGLEPSAQGRVRLWGRHPVVAALGNPDRPCLRLLGTKAAIDALEFTRPGLERRVVEASELDRLVPPDMPHQGLVLEAGPLPERALSELGADPDLPSLVIALDEVNDPRNLGAILRTAAALGAAGVIVPRRRSAELGGVCAKAASGGLDLVPVVEVTNLARALEELKGRGYWVVGLDAAGTARLEDLPPASRRVLVLGAEGSGLRRLVAEGCDQLARLDIDPRIESLNVSVAAAIALYQLTRAA